MRGVAASATPAATVSVPDTSEWRDWENQCRRCGECCFEKTIDRYGCVHTTAVPCRFLDIHERTCRVYDQRQELEDDCVQLTPENIDTLHWLPASCAYRLES